MQSKLAPPPGRTSASEDEPAIKPAIHTIHAVNGLLLVSMSMAHRVNDLLLLFMSMAHYDDGSTGLLSMSMANIVSLS